MYTNRSLRRLIVWLLQVENGSRLRVGNIVERQRAGPEVGAAFPRQVSIGRTGVLRKSAGQSELDRRARRLLRLLRVPHGH